MNRCSWLAGIRAILTLASLASATALAGTDVIEGPGRHTFLIGEPIAITIHIANRTSETIPCVPQLSLTTQTARAEWSTDGTEFRRIRPFSIHDPPPRSLPVEPGHSFVGRIVLQETLTDSRQMRLIFDHGCQALVRLHVSAAPTMEGQVDVRVTVAEPTDESDRAALDGLVQAHALALLVSPAQGISPEQRETLEMVARGDSGYAPYAALSLAREALMGTEFGLRLEAARKHRQERAERAAHWAAIADAKDFPLRDESVWALREAAKLSGDPAKARQLGQRIRTEFKDGVASQRLAGEEGSAERKEE